MWWNYQYVATDQLYIAVPMWTEQQIIVHSQQDGKIELCLLTSLAKVNHTKVTHNLTLKQINPLRGRIKHSSLFTHLTKRKITTKYNTINSNTILLTIKTMHLNIANWTVNLKLNFFIWHTYDTHDTHDTHMIYTAKHKTYRHYLREVNKA